MALFSNLTERLTHTVNQLTGRGRLTEKNISETLKDIRTALLEADVALPVVKKFIDTVRSKAIGQDITKSLKPGDMLVKIVHTEIARLMGEQSELNLKTQPPAIILMVGLQGAGKTTTAAKLAFWITLNLKKSVLLTSTDIYRPAAMAQLKTLAEKINLECYLNETSKDPVALAKEAVLHAKKRLLDVVIVDTAGRLHVDEEMMKEITQMSNAIQPAETLFVVDSMTGQDAAATAKAFNDSLPLTGIILTKTDGDARGGAALSVAYMTEKPIKFLGTGEKLDKDKKEIELELFHPERIASRILGMGDVLSLVEEVERKIDKQKAEALAKKVKAGQDFSLEDFKGQLEQMRNMGGISKLIEKLPGMMGGGGMPPLNSMGNEKDMIKMEAIINSMTPQERHFPDIIKNSRKQRIALGSGTLVTDINRLLKQFWQMQKMMKKFKGGGTSKLMKRLKQMNASGMF